MQYKLNLVLTTRMHRNIFRNKLLTKKHFLYFRLYTKSFVTQMLEHCINTLYLPLMKNGAKSITLAGRVCPTDETHPFCNSKASCASRIHLVADNSFLIGKKTLGLTPNV